jgi:hypothetical protein
MAARFGRSAPLTSINIKWNSARFVPTGSSCVDMRKTAMVCSP